MTRRRLALMLAATGVLAVAVTGAGCGRQDERSLCPVYDDYLQARAAVRDAAVTPRSADAAIEVIDDYAASVRALAAVTDGRYHTAVADLDAAVGGVRLTLEGVRGLEDADDLDVMARLLDDAVEEARSAGDRVVELIGPQCDASGAAGTEG